jgi:hypothetical protein
MQEHAAKTIPQNRSLTDAERALLEWLLQHSTATPEEKAQLPSVRVIGRCSCGCCTIDLAVDGKSASPGTRCEIIADFCGTTPEGVFVGVMLHVCEGRLSELEVYSLDDAKTFSLPHLEALQPFAPGDSA